MLERLFNPEAPLWRALTKVADIVWLNICWLAFSLPIVTIGASQAALHDCCRRMADGTDGPITSMFWRAFRSNFRQATLLWAVLAATGVAAGVVWVYGSTTPLAPLNLILAIVWAIAFPLVWAIQARFANSVPNTLRNTLVIAFGRLPWSLAILLGHAAWVGLIVAVALWLPLGLPFLLLAGYPLALLGLTHPVNRALAPLYAATSAQQGA